MIETYREYYGNAESRTHIHGQKARQRVEEARLQVAHLLGVESNEIVFTSGATESNNLAILGLQDYAVSSGRKHILTTSIEHKSVLEAVNYLGRNGYEIEFVNPDVSGRINAEELLSRVRPNTLLVSVQHVNSETGIIQPVEEIGKGLSDSEVLFHIDAVQSCGKLVKELQSLKYNMLTISAHKMCGPQGIGALILRRQRHKLPPVKSIMYGGNHELGLRPGTIPVALIAGFGEACEIANSERKHSASCIKDNRDSILLSLDQSGVDYRFNGDQKHCINNTVNISFINVNSEALMIAAKEYFSVSNGSACTSKDYKPSYVLAAMGLSSTRLDTAIRLSWGRQQIELRELQHFLSVIYDFQN
jgi:cysteine desulfurase